jgi:hypothetical protein
VTVLRRTGTRFVVEVLALCAAAAITGLLRLGGWTIIAAVAVVWAAIAVFEYGLAHPEAARRPAMRRTRKARPARRAAAEAPATVVEEEPSFEHVRVLGSRPVVADEEAPTVREAPAPVAERTAPEPLPEPAVAAAVTAAAVAADAAAPAPEQPETPAAVEEPPAEPSGPEAEAVPVASAPWSWNVWNLERVVRERASANDELNYLLLYLREYANPAGMLPPDFDALVRESFGDLLAAPS